MVGHHCKCSEVPVCPGESPFSFASREECDMNLAVMLAHEQSDAPVQGRNSAPQQEGIMKTTGAIG
jgi:hypothetical protein